MKVFDIDFIINILRFLEMAFKSHPEIVAFSLKSRSEFIKKLNYEHKILI